MSERSAASRDPARRGLLFVAPHWPPDQGAAAARLSGLARELAALGHVVEALAPAATYLTPATAHSKATSPGSARVGDDLWSPVPVERVSVAPRGAGAAANAMHQVRVARALAGALAQRLRRGDVGTVLVSSPPPVAALAAARTAAASAGGAGSARAAPRPRIVVDVRDMWPDVLVDSELIAPWGANAAALRCVERRLLATADLVVTPTREKQRRLRARCTADVALVPNGVDATWIEGPPATGGRADELEILWAGNVGRAQDVELLVRATARAARIGLPVRATVVGAGERLASVRDEVTRLEAPVTLAGVESRASVRRRLVAAGCAFVSLRSARLTDAVPSKLLEAMAVGVPVVLAAAGEPASLLEASGGGLVVPPGDVAATVAAFAHLSGRSPEQRLAMGLRGRLHVLDTYRREQAAERLAAALDGVQLGR